MGSEAWLARFRTGAWALTLPLSIAVVVAAISLASPAADVLTWVALLLVPAGCALAFGWAMLAALSTRFTSQPQRWALVPAAFMAVVALALLVDHLGDKEVAKANVESFMCAVVANFDNEWEMTSDDLDQVLTSLPGKAVA